MVLVSACHLKYARAQRTFVVSSQKKSDPWVAQESKSGPGATMARENGCACYLWSLHRHQQKQLKRERASRGTQFQEAQSIEFGPVHFSETSLPR